MAALLWWREREITDGLLDLLVRVVHKIGARAEKRVEKELLEDLKKVTGKTNLLFRMAEVAVENPEGTVREVLYPVVGEATLKELVKEVQKLGSCVPAQRPRPACPFLPRALPQDVGATPGDSRVPLQ